jgi:predicted nuclease of restriction endonuclease-like RecB superfamily
LCTVVEGASGRGVELELSGPYALFRRTLVYGRALASVVPRAARCHFFELRARCILDASASPKILVVRSGAPIFPAHALEPFDSKLEERFQRDFLRAAPDWDLVREPEAVPACGTLVFPDFLLQHRRHRERRWLLEIVGFWTPLYLEQKLSRLRAAGLQRFILCVDADRACAEDELPKGAHVVRFRRRVDPKAVLAIVEPSENNEERNDGPKRH